MAPGIFGSMSTLTIELSDDLAARLAAVSAAQKMPPSKWAKEAVARALPPMPDAQAWPAGYFEKFPGCLAGDDWQPPADPPPERSSDW